MNDVLWKIMMVNIYRLRDRFINMRSVMIFAFMCIYICLQEGTIKTFCKYEQMKCTPWGFSFFSSDWIVQMLISGIFIWFLSVLSERTAADKYIIYRTGTLLWELGNILCLIIATFFFVVLLVILSQIILFPYIDFSNEWGLAWNILSKTDAISTYNVSVSIDPYIIHAYTPIRALFFSFVLQFFSLLLLGTIQYCLNNLVKRNFGTFIAMALIMMDVFLANTSLDSFYRFSPVTLAQLGNYSIGSLKYGYDLKYAICFYVTSVVIIILLLVCAQIWRKYESDSDRKFIKKLR